jgi:hypothetical protein
MRSIALPTNNAALFSGLFSSRPTLVVSSLLILAQIRRDADRPNDAVLAVAPAEALRVVGMTYVPFLVNR